MLQASELAFSLNQFYVDDKARIIRCSRIFKWYSNDFPVVYLDDPRFAEYQVDLQPYGWSVA